MTNPLSVWSYVALISDISPSKEMKSVKLFSVSLCSLNVQTIFGKFDVTHISGMTPGSFNVTDDSSELHQLQNTNTCFVISLLVFQHITLILHNKIKVFYKHNARQRWPVIICAMSVSDHMSP